MGKTCKQVTDNSMSPVPEVGPCAVQSAAAITCPAYAKCRRTPRQTAQGPTLPIARTDRHTWHATWHRGGQIARNRNKNKNRNIYRHLSRPPTFGKKGPNELPSLNHNLDSNHLGSGRLADGRALARSQRDEWRFQGDPTVRSNHQHGWTPSGYHRIQRLVVL